MGLKQKTSNCLIWKFWSTNKIISWIVSNITKKKTMWNIIDLPLCMCSLNSCFTVLVIISIIAIFYMKQKQRIFIDSPLIISQRDAVIFWVKSCCCWPIHSEDNHLSSNQVHLHIHVQDLPAEPKSMQLYLSTSCLCPYQKKTIHTKFKNMNYLCLTKSIALTRRSQINNIWDNCWKITRSSPSSFQGDTGL